MSDELQQSWADVAPAAAKMFNVWTDGDELTWARESWGHLHAAGLIGQDNLIQDTASKLRLVTLACIYQEFCGLAWDENPEVPASAFGEDLVIDPIALGILAGSTDYDKFEDALEDYELLEDAYIAVTTSQRSEIFHCLRKAYGGEAALYQRLWHTRPHNEGEEFETNGSNSAAYMFVTNGFRS